MNKLRILFVAVLIAGGVYYAIDTLYDLGTLTWVEQARAPESVASQDEEDEEEVLDEAEMADEAASHAMAADEPAPTADRAAAPVAAPKRALPTIKPADVKLTIQEIKFDGVTAFTHEALREVVKDFVGQELTVQEAFAIPAKIIQHYQKHNMVARATLVGSLNREGVLKIGVIETQVTPAQVQKELTAVAANTTPAPKPELKTETLVATPAPQAASAKTEPALSTVAKLEVKQAPVPEKPPVPAAAPVVATAPEVKQTPAENRPKVSEEDETAFILKHYAKQSRQYEIIADNHGYEPTGSQRLGAAMKVDGILLHDDKLSILGLKSEGSDYLRLAYEWATGWEGLKVGASLSRLNYEVVNGVQNAFNLSGDAVKKSFQVVYELVNEPGHVSQLGLSYDSKSFHNTAATASNSAVYSSTVPGLSLKGVVRDLTPGGAVFTYDTVFAHGRVDMNGSPNQAADASGEHTDGVFSKLRFTGTILQPLGGFAAMFGSLTFQRADKNLDASEKMYIGGPLGIRAYGVGEGAGSEGEMASFELRQKLGASTSLSEFYDWGRVRPYHDANFTGAPSVNSAVLKGYGVSLSHQFAGGLTLRGTWARREGDTPDGAAMPSGHDGHYDRNRYWLSLESRF